MKNPNFEWIKKDWYYILLIIGLLILFLTTSMENAQLRMDCYEKVCPKTKTLYGEPTYKINITWNNGTQITNQNT